MYSLTESTNKPVKTHGKDIMLLCKGWYDKDKYKTLKDALVAYYNKNYRYPEDYVEDLDYHYINTVLLKQAIQELLTERFNYMFIGYLFDTDGFMSWKFDRFVIKDLSYDEELFYRLCMFIDNLLLIDKNDKGDVINIDTSAYYKKDENGNIIYDENHCRTLDEPIIN